MYEKKYPMWVQKYTKATTSKGEHAIIFFGFCNLQVHTKNICVKVYKNSLNDSSKAEDNMPERLRSVKKTKNTPQ